MHILITSFGLLLSPMAFSAVSLQLNGNLVDLGPQTSFVASFVDLEIDQASSTATVFNFGDSSSSLMGSFQTSAVDPITSFSSMTVSIQIIDSADSVQGGAGDLLVLSGSNNAVDLVFVDSDGTIFEQFAATGILPSFSDFESADVFGLSGFSGFISDFSVNQSASLIPEPSVA